MEIQNSHKVPQGIWETFTAEGKLRFNNVMDKALYNQSAFIHPMAFEMPHSHWDTVVYNIACIAAWNEFDLNYRNEQTVQYTATEKLTRLTRHKDVQGLESDAELV